MDNCNRFTVELYQIKYNKDFYFHQLNLYEENFRTQVQKITSLFYIQVFGTYVLLSKNLMLGVNNTYSEVTKLKENTSHS